MPDNFLSSFNSGITKEIANSLSNLPRYDFSGKYSAENDMTFNPNDEHYWESLSIYATFFWLVALFILFYSCCLCSFRGIFSFRGADRQILLKFALAFSFVLSVCFLIFGLLESSSLNASMQGDLNDIDANTQRIHSDLNNVTYNLNQINQTTIWGYVVNVPGKFNQTIESVQSNLDFWIDTGSPVAHSASNGFDGAIFVILALFVVFSCCGLVTLCCAMPKCLVLDGTCILLLLPFLLVASGFLFATDIFLVDGCPNVDSYVQQHSSDSQYIAFVWYTSCPPLTESSNPLSGIDEYLEKEIKDLDNAIEKAKRFHVPNTIVEDLTHLKTEVTQIQEQLHDANDCEKTATMYNNVHENVCSDVIGGFYVLFILFIILAIFKCIYSTFLMCCLISEPTEEETYMGYYPINE